MEKNVPYVRVGLFVVVALIMMIALALFLAFKNMDTEKQSIYSILTEETVSGLTVGSPVKYHGLQVGSISLIQIADPKLTDTNDSLVVIIKINANTPINSTTEAIFEPAGITGQLYVNLITDTELAAPVSKSYNGILSIPNAPGLLKKYSIQLTELFKNMTTISKKVEKLLSPENVDNISSTIAGLNALIKTMNDQAAKITPALSKVGETLDQGQNTLKDISTTAKSITVIANGINKQLSTGEFNLRPDIERLKNDIGKTTRDADALIRRVDSIMFEIQMSPIDFIFNGANLQPGPGEEPK